MNPLSEQEKQVITQHAFGQLLSTQTTKAEFPELVYCPLQLINENTLLGHLSKGNPLIKKVDEESIVKAIFTGPHGYISPRWHAEQVVPTWNYVSVALTCSVSFIENRTEKLLAMKTISQHFDPQWNFNEFHQEKNTKLVQQMLAAISVFRLKIIGVNSKFKLSQNRSLACRTAFAKNLQLTGYSELADIQV